MSDDPYEPDADAQAAIARHMNEDHTEDTAVIARAYADDPSIMSAVVSAVDGAGMDLLAEGPAGRRTVRVPWSEPLADRPAVRAEVVKAYQFAHEWAAQQRETADQGTMES